MKIKKNRILFALLTVCLATTCVIGGTVAKYTVGTQDSDSATVAKWGIKLSIADSLLRTLYDNEGNVIADGAGGVIKVQSSGDMKVVAPGTSGGMLELQMSGTSEVDTRLSAKLEVRNVFLSEGKYGVMTLVGKGTAFSEVAFAQMVQDKSLFTKTGSSYQLVTDSVKNDNTDYYILQNDVVLEKDYYPIQFHSQGRDENGDPVPDVILPSGSTITADFNKDFWLSNSYSYIDTFSSAAARMLLSLKGQGYLLPSDTKTSIEGHEFMQAPGANGIIFYEMERTIESGQDFGQILNGIMEWKWPQSDANKSHSAADTILGMLASQNQDVVFLNDTTNEYEQLLSDAYDAAKIENAADQAQAKYCVDLHYLMVITIEQVD